jgi:dihydroxy-acid dehydratase
MIGLPFGVPGVSDNITQGHEGGNASLPSRNVIANATEMVASAHCYDAVIGLHHCDKNGPGFAMALARLNYPGLIVSGGSILPGCYKEKPVTILDAYDAQAQAAIGAMSYAESEAIIRVACPGPGGCGIAASFNTWGITLEAIGLMLPDSSSIPATDAAKYKENTRIAAAVRQLLRRDIRPRDILTKPAFVNAMTVMAAIGGSTNGVLHLLALAQEAQINFTLRDVQDICRRTPVLCNFAPRGRGTMVDLHRLGGTSMLLKHLWIAGLLDDTCMTVTGARLGELLFDAPDLPPHQDLIAAADLPFKPHADMQICFGNLAPEGIVFKVSSMKSAQFSGQAICFTDAKEVQEAAAARKIRPGHIVILRGLGPVGSGMPEVLVATAALSTPELDGKVALISDTRVSGVSHGAIGVHCSPEAAVGGPIAWVHDGDIISFDLTLGDISWHVSEEELARRKTTEPLAAMRYQRTYLADFAATVAQAHLGCVSKHISGG